MRMPWNKSKVTQLDLLDDAATVSSDCPAGEHADASGSNGFADEPTKSRAALCDADMTVA